jgi:hypothetical protein
MEKDIMKLDFLQIGFQKCGTTFLEYNVYPTNPNVSCLQAANNQELERLLLNKFILPDGLEYDENEFKKAFSEVTDKLFHDNKTIGIMFEPFTFLYQRRFDRKNVLDRIIASFPNIKIITFIRNQESWLLSHYSQYLKSGGLLSLHDFIECQLNNPFLDAHYIDWYLIISYLYEKIDREKVLVCLYEELNKSPQETADKIFSFLNVPSSKINPMKVNPSLGYYGLALRRILNHFCYFDCGASSYTFHRDIYKANPSLYSKFKHKFIYSYYKPITNIICYKLDDLFKVKKSVRLEETQVDKINARYGENNKKLSDLLGVNLTDYDYPFIKKSS